ncbi:HNH endonuclease [Bradyrhizobium algeriense]|uniref:HNH endonuclease n=1 Tax=Bradyrhizobium algeriense TaxID=634784 RepID=UPI000D331930|nr:HNH endonuclease signature motif containing protein [Bradyrhizobium algeriense]
MKSIWIRWTNKDSRNYVDIVPLELFRSETDEREIEHLVRRPNGTAYAVKSNLFIRRNIATLTYRANENPPNATWLGITRITFEGNERREVRRVDWQDANGQEFVDLGPIISLEDNRATAARYFVVKAHTAEVDGNSLKLSGQPIDRKKGGDISVGDRVFVWIFENSGGHGLEWYGRVRALDRRDPSKFVIRIEDLQKATSKFGAAEIDKLYSSKNLAQQSLFEKLKTYSPAGIRRVDQTEADELLALFSLDALQSDGQDEVARLIRLGKIASRPNQSTFSASIRRTYENTCAITGSTTTEVLEAAHIKVGKGVDDNSLENGILLRADIHALFDAGLIALTLDGKRLELSMELEDSAYQFLRKTNVFQPSTARPSEANIRHHRLRFGFPC